MPVTLATPRPEHFEDMARICHDAFHAFQIRHGFEPDFPDRHVARRVIEAFSNPTSFVGFVALDGGRVVGSNFISVMDQVGGIGPITVDPAAQSKKVGRLLMQAVIDAGRARPGGRLRLMQDAHNTTSLSLYASLGFDWRCAVASMQIPPNLDGPSDGVRAMTMDDAGAADALCQNHQKVSRANELRWALSAGMPAVLRERSGQVVSFMLPGQMGHGAAEQIDDVLAMFRFLTRGLPAPGARFFCPLVEHELHRAAMKLGCRTLRVMNLMTMGPYEHPDEVWLPSILY